MHERVERRDVLLLRDVGVVAVGVVEVDVVGLQAAQRVVDGRGDVGRRQPGTVGLLNTFVWISTRSRLPREASHSPMIVSDSPPVLPGTHCE